MGLGRWRQTAQRLARMDRAELRGRLHQEFAKREDALLGQLGFSFGRDQRQPAPAQGNFFCAGDSLASLLALLQQRIPGYAEGILKKADRICQHRFDLLGYADLSYGSPIDWHLDLVHGQRAPKKAFYRVPYLDFARVGDSKVTWELNRHQHFLTLAKAYRLSGDARYADEILRQWRHWWAENPYPVGINWASSLEVGFRSLSWLWTRHLLEGAPGVPDFREEWLRGLALHGRHIERYLSTYFSPNTHLLGEGVALFFLGVLCPELPSAERWKTLGWKIVLEESRRQVRPDGFHFEQSTYYHVYALDFFLHAAVLASVNHIAVPREFEESLERMLTVLTLFGRAGHPTRFGDDDGGRVFDPQRNGSEHLLDPLSTGAILFNRADFKAAAGHFREETIWLLGAEGLKIWDELEAKPASMDSAALPDSGVYLLTAQTPPTQLVVDCNSLGSDSAGHGHADALSVTLQSEGHSLLIDPGTCEYVGDGGDRNSFRGTAMHNTVTVDGVGQAEPATPFSWRRLGRSKAESWIRGRSFDYFVGSYSGNEQLPDAVIHRRWVFSLKNGLYLVRDRIEGQGRHQLEISWHLSPEMQLVEHGIFRRKGASQGLALLPAEPHSWAVEVDRQSCSPVYGQKSPMTVLKFSKGAELPYTFCCAIVTLQEVLGSPGIFAQTDGRKPDSNVSAYEYLGQQEEYSFFFGVAGKEWRSAMVSSDAEFVCHCRSRKLAGGRLILVNGTRAEVDGGPALRFTRHVSFAELIMNENQREIFSSDQEALAEEPVVSSQVDCTSNLPL
jgi:hypothetical protein